MDIRQKQTLSICLSIFGALGTIVTAYLTRKAAFKEVDILRESPPEDVKDKIKTVIPIYIPAIIGGSVTIASIIGSIFLSRKVEASLAAVAILADQGWRKYKRQVKNMFGTDKHIDILKGVAKTDYEQVKKDIWKKPEDTRRLYHEEHVGYFLADPVKLAFSYADMNQRLHIEDFGETSFYVLIYNFLQQADAELLNKDIKPEDLKWGWSYEYLGDQYSHAWIHMTLHEVKMDDGTICTEIEWCEESICDPGNSGEAFLGKEPPGPDDDIAFSTVLEKPKRRY